LSWHGIWLHENMQNVLGFRWGFEGRLHVGNYMVAGVEGDFGGMRDYIVAGVP
jgi:hypothetical protein